MSSQMQSGKRLMFEDAAKEWKRFKNKLQERIPNNGTAEDAIPFYHQAKDLVERTYPDTRFKMDQLREFRQTYLGFNLATNLEAIISFCDNVIADCESYEQAQRNELDRCQMSKMLLEDQIRDQQHKMSNLQSRITELNKDLEVKHRLNKGLDDSNLRLRKEYNEEMKVWETNLKSATYSKVWHFVIVGIMLSETNYLLKASISIIDWLVYGVVEIGILMMLYYWYRKEKDWEMNILKGWGILITLLITYVKVFILKS